MGQRARASREARGGEERETSEFENELNVYDYHSYLVSQVLDNWKRLIRGLTIKQKIKLKYMKD